MKKARTGHEIIGSLDDIQITRLAEIIKRTEGWIPGKITRAEAPQ
jgi:hypothetical protein